MVTPIRCRTAGCLVALATLPVIGATALPSQDQLSAGYASEMAIANEAKERGDMATMEQAITRALRLGPGDEYAWRSLSWAQMHLGKWRESLQTARENVRRNGKTSWSLQQLYASAMAAGDIRLAGRALNEEERLPASARNRSLDDERKAFRAATNPTEYDLTWRLRVADYKVQRGEIVVNVPFRKHLWQRATVWFEGARSWRIEAVGNRDVAFVTPDSGDTIILRAKVTHTPEVRGGGFAERTRTAPVPADHALLLGPFRNRIDYDPADPQIQAIVAPMRRLKPGERVQAVLDWLAANIRYEAGYPDDLESILRNRKGVCHHQSNLMVAMCRALGVPALVAHGVRLGAGDGEIKDVVASHGWVEVWLDGRWVGVEPLNPNSLRLFDSGYLIVDATGRGSGPEDDHFLMHTPDGRHIEGIQGVAVSGSMRVVASRSARTRASR